MRLGLTLQERWYALSRPQQWVIGGGAAALLLFILTRKPVRTAVSTAIDATERAILKGLVGTGQDAYIDASFNIGARDGVSPYLLLGTLYIESGFGKALTKGSAFGQTVYTGDFIPRPATPERDAFMAKYPLPGAVRTYWERPKIGNLPEFKGQMWVPAHDLRVAAAGSPQAAYAKNGGVAGGVGWGFSAWQLDWQAFAPALLAGAAWDPEKATAEAVKLIKANIRTLKAKGFVGTSLVQGVIAAYNAGAGRVASALSSGKDLNTITAKPDYIAKVMSVANKVGRSIDIA